MTFAERVLDILQEKHISQAKLLQDLGLGKNQLAYWKKNDTVPNARAVEKIAEYLGVSMDYLLGKTDEKKPPSPASALGELALTQSEQEVIRLLRKMDKEQLIQAILELQRILEGQEKSSKLDPSR